MRSFTLIELIIVVIIIGILVTYAAPKFLVTQERALDKEAIANLKLIVAAEKIYKMETGSYHPSTAIGSDDNVASLNTNLKLFLNENKWDYKCDTSATEATAKRIGKDCTWTLAYTSLGEPTPSGKDCPK